MITAALAALLAVASPAQELSPFHTLADGQVARELKKIHERHPTLRGRVEAVSERFLGTPYTLGPLGEGADGEFDRDPRINFKAVDCTTLVEQVMALALQSDLKEAEKTLQKIRYEGGRIGYATRNHFPETDWLPRNIEAGALRDITREIAGTEAREAAKTISKRLWYAGKSTASFEGAFTEAEKSERLPRLQALGEGFPDQRTVLPYLPIERLPEALPRIPSGTIANLVRQDQPGKPVLISHQVLIIQKNGQPFVRHAAAGKAVEDVAALDYFRRYSGSKWPLLGLNLDEIRQP